MFKLRDKYTISDPYGYLLLVVGLYQRIIPYFLDEFQCVVTTLRILLSRTLHIGEAAQRVYVTRTTSITASNIPSMNLDDSSRSNKRDLYTPVTF